MSIFDPTESKEEWLHITGDFEERWNMPHTIGAIDGKHIRIKCLAESGTLFHNYKGFFSLVLMAICDANYCFTVIDVGDYGSNKDSGVLAQSKMGCHFDDGKMNLPNPSTLIGCQYDPLPYFLVGDEIFPLKTWLMRPYPGKGIQEEESIYNYRHSRARRVIENAFGILVARWRIFNVPINASVENIERYVNAAIVLHNYLRQTENATYCPLGFIDSEDANGNIKPGLWRECLPSNQLLFSDLPSVRGSR